MKRIIRLIRVRLNFIVVVIIIVIMFICSILFVNAALSHFEKILTALFIDILVDIF